VVHTRKRGKKRFSLILRGELRIAGDLAPTGQNLRGIETIPRTNAPTSQTTELEVHNANA
jgi:hypothetical protein